MSRRQKSPAGTHVDYGLLKLKCPSGHELGAVLARRNIYRMTPDQFGAFRRDESPGVGVTVEDAEEVIPGQPVRGTCPICKQQGRAKYWYEQPWDVIEAYLRGELHDTHSAQRTVTLY
jgi:hypothetical protein